ncbi:MAG: hypothetical protein KME10_11745 [Plectolyngbya sp. WJT66-NPBG17]|jgi:hypothetical protein|nr:hypothetical protein [Plectolyngbya sp. WJT66-NPBG17]
MPQRKQFSLPDDAAAILQSLTADCGIDASTVLTQLLRRYHPQLRQLFAIDSGVTQPITTSQAHHATSEPLATHNAVERRNELQPIVESASDTQDKPKPPLRTPITSF